MIYMHLEMIIFILMQFNSSCKGDIIRFIVVYCVCEL